MNSFFRYSLICIGLAFVFMYSPAPSLCAQTAADNENIVATVKAVASKNADGEISVTLIPYNNQGSYPRSGWITCRMMPANIKTMFLAELDKQPSTQGFFVATYRKTGEDLSSPILAYTGELISLEPWTPPFEVEVQQGQ